MVVCLGDGLGVPHLSPDDIWDRLQNPAVRRMDGWIKSIPNPYYFTYIGDYMTGIILKPNFH